MELNIDELNILLHLFYEINSEIFKQKELKRTKGDLYQYFCRLSKEIETTHNSVVEVELDYNEYRLLRFLLLEELNCWYEPSNNLRIRNQEIKTRTKILDKIDNDIEDAFKI